MPEILVETRPKRSAANTGEVRLPEKTSRSIKAAEAAPMPDDEGNTWPSWRYGPNNAAKVCQSAADVPKGWKDHPRAFAQPDASEAFEDL